MKGSWYQVYVVVNDLEDAERVREQIKPYKATVLKEYGVKRDNGEGVPLMGKEVKQK